MDIFFIFMVAVGLAMDAFAVSVSCGLCVIERRLQNALKAALFFGFFQWGMLTLGWLAGFTFRTFIEPVDHWIAFVLLAFIGVRMWRESLSDSSEPLDLSSLKLMLTLALATSIDAFAAGISITALGYPIVLPSIIVGIITFALSFVGVLLGCWITQYAHLRKYLDRIGATILIGIGFKILLEHLI
ncbi:MAG: manganese efflux pump [Clostridiaceae bacterium]|jgi:putative Mn2+ efflux pump MntP|nr:manganese efflux pump [Clostridiaceae bacterium]